MSTLHAEVEIRDVKNSNNEVIQGAPVISSPSVLYNTATLSGSTDPFASKASKFAESRTILLFGTRDFHIRMGTASIEPAVTTDMMIPAFTWMEIGVDDVRPYLRMIESTGTSPQVQVIERF